MEGILPHDIATLAGGSFWFLQAAYDDVIGVVSVESGYTGGTAPSPTYELVCDGASGHAEAVRIGFDPDVIGYADILDIFFHIIDPTQLNRQGIDIGSQYRSAIFAHSAEQAALAKAAIGRAQAAWGAKIMTKIEGDAPWNRAEDRHQGYSARAGAESGYCMAVVAPKLAAFRKRYAERLKAGVGA